MQILIARYVFYKKSILIWYQSSIVYKENEIVLDHNMLNIDSFLVSDNQILLVDGEAGSGKSALVKRIMENLSDGAAFLAKDKDRNDPPSGGSAGVDRAATRKCSTTDPESGWFRKGEHKHVSAYAVQTACERNGWVMGYTVHPGNEHDSRIFKSLYDKIKGYAPEMVIMDAGYRTPAIAHELLTDGIQPLLPYKRPMTRDGFFKKYEYVYDEYYDCYICPEEHILTYRTTTGRGIGSIRVVGPTAPTVRALRDAPTARAMSRQSPGMYGKDIWRQWKISAIPVGTGISMPGGRRP